MQKLYIINPLNPIVIGKIRSVYGIKGWMKIFSFTEISEQIFLYKPWFIKKINKWQLIKLESWEKKNKNIIIQIKNVKDPESAKRLVNYKIFTNRSKLPKLKFNEYYWVDLLGCTVINTNGYCFGKIIQLIETGTNDVLVIKPNKLDLIKIKKIFVPFLYKTIIKKIDLKNKIIKVNWDPHF